MKKHTEKPPIDDLFARKLGDMSLQPSPDGFERLQTRMGQTKPEARVVFWRNPAIYGYTAAAACVVLVCLFGWLYWPDGNKTIPEVNQVAANRSAGKNSQQPVLKQEGSQPNGLMNEPKPGLPVLESVKPVTTADQVAEAKKLADVRRSNNGLGGSSAEVKKVITNGLPATNQTVVAQTTPTETKAVSDAATPVSVSTPLAPERIAENTVKPTPATERVLEVTIAEPEGLVAARQAVKNSVDEKSAVASVPRPEKETKAGNLWEQVKRLKRGEVVARQNKDDAEHSLLDRAYNGLRHSFDKDKSAKQ